MTRRSSQQLDFGALRSLLHQPPSEAGWERLYDLLATRRHAATAEQWLPYAQDHLDRHWPDALRVWLPRYFSSDQPPAAWLARAAALHDVSRKQLRGQIIPALARQAPPLKRLSVGQCNIDQPLLAALLAATPDTLTTLRLSGCETPLALEPLTTWAQLPALASLDLGLQPASSIALHALVERLRAREVHLRHMAASDAPRLALGEALGRGALGETLEVLGLASCPLSDVDMVGLGAAKRLKAVTIDRAEWTNHALRLLLERLPALESLSLLYNTRDAGLADALRAMPRGSKLRALTFRPLNPLDAHTLSTALYADALSELESVELSSVADPNTLGALARCAPTLRSLCVHYSPQAGPTIASILASRAWPKLESLEISMCGFDDRALDKLLGATLPALHTLRLAGPGYTGRPDVNNPVTLDALERLPRAAWFGQLTTLTFDTGGEDRTRVEALLSHPAAHPALSFCSAWGSVKHRS